MAQQAVIVVDMLNDFVTGSLACDRGKAIVGDVKRLVEEARAHDIPVIYSNDIHLKGIDKELELWGDHAIKGTPGAEVIPEIAPQDGDFVVPKRRYSGFFQTDLELLLDELGVETVVLAGLHTHMCVRHTAADAYFRGYGVVVPKESVDSFTKEEFESGLAYLKDIYGAHITTLDDLVGSWS